MSQPGAGALDSDDRSKVLGRRPAFNSTKRFRVFGDSGARVVKRLQQRGLQKRAARPSRTLLTAAQAFQGWAERELGAGGRWRALIADRTVAGATISKVLELDRYAGPVDTHMDRRDERRKRQRLAVHWPIRVSGAGKGNPVKSITENLSSCGFYFVSPDAFRLGEQIEWLLTVPSQMTGRVDLMLRGFARVIRTKEVSAAGTCGIGCAIEDYGVVPLILREPDQAEEPLFDTIAAN